MEVEEGQSGEGKRISRQTTRSLQSHQWEGEEGLQMVKKHQISGGNRQTGALGDPRLLKA